jgi:hypothetical protein
VDQQSLQDVGVPSEVHAAHPAGFVEMREGPSQAFAAGPQQTQASRPADAATIPIDRRPRLGLFLPVAAPAIGFGDVAPYADGFEIDERLIAVIPLVADDLLQAVALGQHGFDLLGRGNQRLYARLRVSVIGVVHGG